MSSISGVAPKGTEAVTNFDAKSLEWLQKASEKRDSALESYRAAGDELAQAGDKTLKSLGYVGTAGLDAMLTVGHGGATVLKAGEAAGNALYGVGLVGAGGVIDGLEGLRGLTASALNGFGHMCIDASNWMSRGVGDGQNATMVERQAASYLRMSDKLYAEAKVQFSQAGDDIRSSGEHFVWTMAHLLATGVDTVTAGVYAAGALGDVGQAAYQGGKGAFKDLAADCAILAALVNQAEENAVQVSADGLVLLARFAAGSSNVIGNPDDPKAQVQVAHNQKIFDASFWDLLNASPQLAALPSAKEWAARHPQ